MHKMELEKIGADLWGFESPFKIELTDGGNRRFHHSMVIILAHLDVSWYLFIVSLLHTPRLLLVQSMCTGTL